MEKLCDLVHENIQDDQKTQKEWYDNARDCVFRPGNQMVILHPTSTNKLQARRGPYPVIRKVSDVNYEVKLTVST